MNREAILNQARALEAQCVADRRHLHANPETGFNLEQTFAYVRKRLEEMGLSPQSCGRCGLVCTLGRPGKTILLRADMDALPIREEIGLDYASANGCMHACGHDMHTAMLLSAAQILKSHEAELQGTVKLMFQSAEEPLQGAQDMVDAGVLENPHVDAALMFHVMTGQSIPAGTVIISAPGVSAPAAGMFTIRVQGKGSHGAMPNTGVDPINAAAHIVLALQEINAREIALSESAALTIGMFQAGNTANVIPDAAVLRGNYRTFSDETMELLRRRIVEISQGVAAAFRASAEVSFDSGCPTLVNDAALSARVEGYLAELLAPGQVFNAAKIAGSSVSRSSGSEDFANLSHRVPSLMMALAAGEPDKGHAQPLHNPGTTFDERALVPGCASFAYLAMRYLEDEAKI